MSLMPDLSRIEAALDGIQEGLAGVIEVLGVLVRAQGLGQIPRAKALALGLAEFPGEVGVFEYSDCTVIDGVVYSKGTTRESLDRLANKDRVVVEYGDQGPDPRIVDYGGCTVIDGVLYPKGTRPKEPRVFDDPKDVRLEGVSANPDPESLTSYAARAYLGRLDNTAPMRVLELVFLLCQEPPDNLAFMEGMTNVSPVHRAIVRRGGVSILSLDGTGDDIDSKFGWPPEGNP